MRLVLIFIFLFSVTVTASDQLAPRLLLDKEMPLITLDLEAPKSRPSVPRNVVVGDKKVRFDTDPLWETEGLDRLMDDLSNLNNEGNALVEQGEGNDYYRYISMIRGNKTNIYLYQHIETGIYFFRKPANSDNLDAIQRLADTRVKGVVPVLWTGELTSSENGFLDTGSLRDSSKAYIELYIPKGRYATLADVMEYKVTDKRAQKSLKRRVDNQANEILTLLSDMGFTHGHPHDRNVMVDHTDLKSGRVFLIDMEHLSHNERKYYSLAPELEELLKELRRDSFGQSS